LPSKGEVEKSLFDRIAKYENDIADQQSNYSIENKAAFNNSESKG
jgi:hypothetical protein